MKELSIAAALLAGSLSIGTAEAMPMGTINVQRNVTKVDYACGRGWHLTRWGECRRNWR
ncbi:GCG_CRPN prefix-to-repeats domain-containing protein, partial [Rhizobium ruizarguesonis]